MLKIIAFLTIPAGSFVVAKSVELIKRSHNVENNKLREKQIIKKNIKKFEEKIFYLNKQITNIEKQKEIKIQELKEIDKIIEEKNKELNNIGNLEETLKLIDFAENEKIKIQQEIELINLNILEIEEKINQQKIEVQHSLNYKLLMEDHYRTDQANLASWKKFLVRKISEEEKTQKEYDQVSQNLENLKISVPEKLKKYKELKEENLSSQNRKQQEINDCNITKMSLAEDNLEEPEINCNEFEIKPSNEDVNNAEQDYQEENKKLEEAILLEEKLKSDLKVDTNNKNSVIKHIKKCQENLTSGESFLNKQNAENKYTKLLEDKLASDNLLQIENDKKIKEINNIDLKNKEINLFKIKLNDLNKKQKEINIEQLKKASLLQEKKELEDKKENNIFDISELKNKQENLFKTLKS